MVESWNSYPREQFEEACQADELALLSCGPVVTELLKSYVKVLGIVKKLEREQVEGLYNAVQIRLDEAKCFLAKEQEDHPKLLQLLRKAEKEVKQIDQSMWGAMSATTAGSEDNLGAKIKRHQDCKSRMIEHLEAMKGLKASIELDSKELLKLRQRVTLLEASREKASRLLKDIFAQNLSNQESFVYKLQQKVDVTQAQLEEAKELQAKLVKATQMIKRASNLLVDARKLASSAAGLSGLDIKELSSRAKLSEGVEDSKEIQAHDAQVLVGTAAHNIAVAYDSACTYAKMEVDVESVEKLREKLRDMSSPGNALDAVMKAVVTMEQVTSMSHSLSLTVDTLDKYVKEVVNMKVYTLQVAYEARQEEMLSYCQTVVQRVLVSHSTEGLDMLKEPDSEEFTKLEFTNSIPSSPSNSTNILRHDSSFSSNSGEHLDLARAIQRMRSRREATFPELSQATRGQASEEEGPTFGYTDSGRPATIKTSRSVPANVDKETGLFGSMMVFARSFSKK